MKNYNLKVVLPILLMCASALHLVCTGDYNPFADFTNSEVVITDGSFSDGDTLNIFTSETLTVMLAVPEQVEYFRVISPGNRLFEGGEVTNMPPEGKSLSSGPFSFVFSFNDTGANSIKFLTRRVNGEETQEEIDFYVRSPLSQKHVDGDFGKLVRLRTGGVGDRDVVYIWDFRMGTRVMSSVPDTSVVLLFAGADGAGTLQVSDGYHFSPAQPFTFSFVDNTPPEIRFLQDNYIISGNTIRTAETAFFMGISIKDRGIGGADSASINGHPFDIVQDSLYIKIFDRLDTLKDSIPLLIYAMDNPVNRNDTTIKMWLVYDPEAARTGGLTMSVLVPPSDSTIYSVKKLLIMGAVEWFANDSIDVELRIRNGNDSGKVQVKGKYHAEWYFETDLNKGINKITITAFDKNGDSLSSISRVVISDPSGADTLPPVILETTVEGRDASGLVIPSDTAVLKVIAFDEGSGIDSLIVNGVSYPGDGDYFWNIPLPISHLAEGNSFTLRVIDKNRLETRKNLLVYKNAKPVVVRAPQPPFPIPAGNIYRDSIIVRDPDNDPIQIKLLRGDPSMLAGADGSLFWNVDSSKIGTHIFEISLYDGYETVVYTFRMMVIDSADIRESVKFTTTEGDFPEFLETGTLFKMFLETDTSRGARPYQYSASLIESGRPVMVRDDTLLWTPVSLDTGMVHLKITVTDTFMTSDTLFPSILIVPPNRHLKIDLIEKGDTISSGALDLSDSSTTVKVKFHINDPDTSKVEMFSAGALIQGRYNALAVDSARNFSLTLNSRRIDSGFDTVIVTAKDRSGHTDTYRMAVYYGTAPEIPGTPYPENGSILNDSLIRFSWDGGDVDGPVHYSLYASFCPEPVLLSENLQSSSFTLNNLSRSGAYCWKVVASDGKRTVEGPEWSFYLRVPDHVQFLTDETDFRKKYEAGEDSIIVPLSVKEGTGKGLFTYNAVFVSSGKPLTIKNGIIRYLPSVSDTGFQRLIITVTDSTGNSDTLSPAVRITPPVALAMTVTFGGKFTEGGAVDLSDTTEPVKVELLLADSDPDTVQIFQRNTRTIARADSNGKVIITIDPMESVLIDDTMRIVVVDNSEIVDTSFVIHYGSAPLVPSNPVPAEDSLVFDSSVTLFWDCSDPDGNGIVYDVYFGETASPPVLAEGLTVGTISLDHALKSGTYYWKVIARDRKSATAGPVWSFTVDLHNRFIYLNTTITGANITNDIYDIPVLVKIDSTNFDFSSLSPDGSKGGFKFTRSGAKSNLPYQIDSWIGKQAVIWVLVDTVKAGNSEQFIKMSWGEHYRMESNGAAVFDTLNGFAGVWHLQESQPGNETIDIYKDATANGYHGDDKVSNNFKDGVIGLGQNFGGGMSNDWIRLPGNTSLGINTGCVNLEAWFSSTVLYADRVIISLSHGPNDNRYELVLKQEGKLSMITRFSPSVDRIISSVNTIGYAGWHHVFCAADFERDSMFIYIDGQMVNRMAADLPTIYRTPSPLATIGSQYNENTRTYTGGLDEIRVSHVRRSEDWIRFSYMNQLAGSNVIQVRNR